MSHFKRTRRSASVAAYLALSVAMAIAPGFAQAQTCHRLDGAWDLLPDKSNLAAGLSFNPYYVITAVQLSIRTNSLRVAQQWDFSGPHLRRTARYEFTAAGTRQVSGLTDPMDFEYAAISAEWQNCTLVQKGYSHLFGLEVVITSTYVVSPDGRELSILQYGESPISVVERRLVFRKQP
jgi:hypothetical protein